MKLKIFKIILHVLEFREKNVSIYMSLRKKYKTRSLMLIVTNFILNINVYKIQIDIKVIKCNS